MGIEIQIRPHAMAAATALRVVAAVERPLPYADFTVEVAIRGFTFAHHQHIRLYGFFGKGRSLSAELADLKLMILHQHRRDDVPLGREVEERKHIVRIAEAVAAQRSVDVRKPHSTVAVIEL